MKFTSLILGIMFAVSGLLNFSALAAISLDDDTQILSENKKYIRFSGKDDGFEPEMCQETNAVIALGENAEYLFSLSYNWNKKSSRDNNGFEQSGLYLNNEDRTSVYEIPNPDYECFAEISKDGKEVWICTDSYLPFSDKDVNMSCPVIRKYVDGEEMLTIRLSDIFSSKNELEDYMGHGKLWGYCESSDVEKFVFRKSKNNKVIYIDKTTGKITFGFKLHYLLFAFSAILAVIAICCIIKGKKSRNAATK